MNLANGLKMTQPNSNVRSQRVVFIRHGVAQHNVLQRGQTTSAHLQNEKLWDTSLVSEGKHQAVAVGEAVSRYFHPHPVELVVVSPLTRCLQTATLAFPPPGPTMYHNEPTQFVCNELIREAYGVHYPDKRRNRSVLEKHWKAIAFDPAMSETDTWWEPDQRERWDGLQQRTQKFLHWLKDRTEQHIAVVTHGVWMECLLHSALQGRRVYNTDAFACNLNSNHHQSMRSSFVEISEVELIHGQS